MEGEERGLRPRKTWLEAVENCMKGIGLASEDVWPGATHRGLPSGQGTSQW